MTPDRQDIAPQPWHDKENDEEKLLSMPMLSPAQLEVLEQCKTATWDGDLISKSARTYLVKKNLLAKYNGWQVASRDGLAVLVFLGRLKP